MQSGGALGGGDGEEQLENVGQLGLQIGQAPNHVVRRLAQVVMEHGDSVSQRGRVTGDALLRA